MTLTGFLKLVTVRGVSHTQPRVSARGFFVLLENRGNGIQVSASNIMNAGRTAKHSTPKQDKTMKFKNTLTGQIVEMTADFATDENTRLMLEHKSAVWTETGLWAPVIDTTKHVRLTEALAIVGSFRNFRGADGMTYTFPLGPDLKWPELDVAYSVTGSVCEHNGVFGVEQWERVNDMVQKQCHLIEQDERDNREHAR